MSPHLKPKPPTIKRQLQTQTSTSNPNIKNALLIPVPLLPGHRGNQSYWLKNAMAARNLESDLNWFCIACISYITLRRITMQLILFIHTCMIWGNLITVFPLWHYAEWIFSFGYIRNSDIEWNCKLMQTTYTGIHSINAKSWKLTQLLSIFMFSQNLKQE